MPVKEKNTSKLFLSKKSNQQLINHFLKMEMIVLQYIICL